MVYFIFIITICSSCDDDGGISSISDSSNFSVKNIISFDAIYFVAKRYSGTLVSFIIMRQLTYFSLTFLC